MNHDVGLSLLPCQSLAVLMVKGIRVFKNLNPQRPFLVAGGSGQYLIVFIWVPKSRTLKIWSRSVHVFSVYILNDKTNGNCNITFSVLEGDNNHNNTCWNGIIVIDSLVMKAVVDRNTLWVKKTKHFTLPITFPKCWRWMMMIRPTTMSINQIRI